MADLGGASAVTVIEWLLDADHAIRWQVRQDLAREPADVVAAERARVASERWGARFIALQEPDGRWGGAAWSQERMDAFHVLRKSTGEVIDPDWLRFSFPTWWHDVLRGLDHLRDAHRPHDERMAEAIEIVEGDRDAAGRWPLQNVHEGVVHFQMEDGEGEPSRWNTLRARRVLEWFRQGHRG